MHRLVVPTFHGSFWFDSDIICPKKKRNANAAGEPLPLPERSFKSPNLTYTPEPMRFKTALQRLVRSGAAKQDFCSLVVAPKEERSGAMICFRHTVADDDDTI